MSTPFEFSAEALLRELQDLQAGLARGAQVLARGSEVRIGGAPREQIHAEDKVRLFHYRSGAGQRSVPLLIVYALVNRPDMLDLHEDRSLIRGLLARGVDVYLIDWGYPDEDDRGRTLEDYIGGYLDRCIEQVLARSGSDRLHLLGVCQGGTFALCYSALRPARIASLITMVTPVDFHAGDNLLARFVGSVDVDLLVDTVGNVPGAFLNWTFLALKPFRLTGQKYVNFLDLVEDEERVQEFLRMEKWIFDSPDQAGEAFRKFVKELFQENRLVRGEFSLGSETIDLSRINMPVLNVYATEDHLVPPPSSLALGEHVGSRIYETHAFEGGHIGIYVSARAQQEIPNTIERWLGARDQDP